MRLKSLLLAAFAIALCAGPLGAAAQAQIKPPTVTNPERVQPYPPVRIIVSNGRITLAGYVNSEVERQMLGHIARGTLAFGVDNQLKLESERRSD